MTDHETYVIMSHNYLTANTILRKKAPPGKQFKIHSINFANKAGLSAILLVQDRFSEEAPTNNSLGSSWIAAFALENDGVSFQWLMDGYKTKFISVRPQNQSNNVTGLFWIIGSIIPMSKIEAIWEWVRKGR